MLVMIEKVRWHDLGGLRSVMLGICNSLSYTHILERFLLACSDRDPHHRHDNIHALLLSSVVLEAPHAILLVVPVCSRCAVHTSPANARCRTSFCVVCSCLLRVGQMLDDCAIDCELEG